MGKLAKNKRSTSRRHGPAWMEHTLVVNNVAVVCKPFSKPHIAGRTNFGQTFKTLAEVISSQALQETPSRAVRLQKSVSAPTLLLESSTSQCSRVVNLEEHCGERHHTPPSPRDTPPPSSTPRDHPSCCRWARRPDRRKGPLVYDKSCSCKRDKHKRRGKSYKQQETGTSRTCFNETCRRERSVPCMPAATVTDASVQLLYYKDKLTATEHLVEKKDEIIRLQHESLALAERRLATLTAARVELRRTQPQAQTSTASAAQTSAAQTSSGLYLQQQPELVQTLQDNLSIMEELYRESFYETAKQDGLIEKLRQACYDIRDMEEAKEDEVGRLQNVVNAQKWSLDQCQDISAEVDRLKTDIYNFVNTSNDDSGVWEGEAYPGEGVREDLQDITSQLLTLKEILTDTSSSTEEENQKLKEKNVQLQKKISQLQSQISKMESAYTRPDSTYGHSECWSESICGRGSPPPPPRRAAPHAHCHHLRRLHTHAHGTLHECPRRETDHHRSPDETSEHLPSDSLPARSMSSQAQGVDASQRACVAPLSLLQLQVSSAQQRSAALCREARRALCRVRRWAVRMRVRLKEREAEIERQKLEIEDLRKYINRLKDTSLGPLPESKALSERYAIKKKKLEEEEAQCRELRKEIEKIKDPTAQRGKCKDPDEDDLYLDDSHDDECDEEPEPSACKPSCNKSKCRPVEPEPEKKSRFLCKMRSRSCNTPTKQLSKTKLETRNVEPKSSCYEILPGEIAEVDAVTGHKVLVKCRDCERRVAETNAQCKQRTEPQVTTYQEDEQCHEEPCLPPKKKDNKQCNQQVCLLPKKKDVKKQEETDKSNKRPCSCSSKETIICQSNDSLRSLRFKDNPDIMPCCSKSGSPERQVSLLGRTYSPRPTRVDVPVILKCPPVCASASTMPEPCDDSKNRKKKRLKIPKLEVKPNKKEMKKRKEEVKKCRCTGPCRCRCSTQAWKLEACGSRCCSSRSSSGSSDAGPGPGGVRGAAASVDSYHSLLMGHLKKKFPFLAQRWGKCEASVQQPLRSDAGTCRSRPFEELIGTERKNKRYHAAYSNTSGQISTL